MAAHSFLLLLLVGQLLGVFVFNGAQGQTAADWKQRLIYQALTDRFAQDNGGTGVCDNLSDYCGGTFVGLTNKLSYIKQLGFTAIWISPIVLNTPNGYHGYWAQDFTQVNPNFGTSNELKTLVQTANSMGIWVMFDVVANHMGNQDNVNDFSFFVPFNDSSYFHSYCEIEDWTNQQQVEFCRLANLPDLAQENTAVADFLCDWVASLVHTYGIQGLRIDTVPEVPSTFWSQYQSCASVFTMGEVDNGDVSYNAQYQPPLDATLNYPLYYTLQQVYQQKQSMYNIRTMVESERSTFHDSTVLGTFLDNHDNPRFLNGQPDQTLLKNGLAYTLFADGIPIVYYGTEQAFDGGNDPQNRENLWQSNFNQNTDLYEFIATLTSFRNGLPASFYEAQHVESYCDDTFYAFWRDQVYVATSNVGNGQNTQRTITYQPYKDGTVLVNALDSSQTITVNNGQFEVSISDGLPQVYYPQNTDLHHQKVSGDPDCKDCYSGETLGFGMMFCIILLAIVTSFVVVVEVKHFMNRNADFEDMPFYINSPKQ